MTTLRITRPARIGSAPSRSKHGRRQLAFGIRRRLRLEGEEAGLDKTRFAPAPPKWVSPEPFDSQADWEGQLADVPEVTVHITAAAYHGVPVYFQVIAPWDNPGASSAAHLSSLAAEISAAIGASLLVGYLVVGGLFARWHVRRGRGDPKGALRLASFTVLAYGAWALFSYHFVPRSNRICRAHGGESYPSLGTKRSFL